MRGRQRRGRTSRILLLCTIVALLVLAAGVYRIATNHRSESISPACRAVYASVIRHPPADPAPVTQLALTPPMGISTYPHFGTEVDEEQVRGIVDAMASDGLKEAGYEYVNIDDGWQGPRVHGVITTNSRFPCGMKLLGEYIHAHGLKLGLYTTPGMKSCGGFTGSQGYVNADVATFASWGVDAIKLDWCSADYVHAQKMTRAWRAAIERTGRPILLGINMGGNPYTGYWAKNLAQSWRTSDDICPSWYNKTRKHAVGATECYGTKYQSGVYDYLTTSGTDLNRPNVGPGHWADPDSLEAGNVGLSFTEAKTQMSIWAMWSAPLILGCDVRQITSKYLSMLTNPEVIAVDQDRLGVMAQKIPSAKDEQIWVKKLSGNSMAVAVVNLKDAKQVMTLDWSQLGVVPRSVRDLWKHENLPPSSQQQVTIPAHGTELLRVKLLACM